MTEYSIQLCLQIPPPALRQAYLPKSHSQQFSLLIRMSTRPMGTGSWQCFHAAFCTQYFVICFLGRAVGYGLNIALLVSKIYITLKVVIISDICWHILGKPSKHMERNTVNKRLLIQRSQDIIEQRWFPFAFNLKGFKAGQICAVISCFPWHQKSKGQGPGKTGRSVWGVFMQGSMASKSICKKL